MRSKKPSAASSPSTLPNPPVFFLDRSIGTKVVAFALRQAGAHVEIHDDHFPPAAPDAEWLREVGSRGWIVLTKDQRIRYRTTELVALTRARVRAFVLTAGDLRGVDMAEIFDSDGAHLDGQPRRPDRPARAAGRSLPGVRPAGDLAGGLSGGSAPAPHLNMNRIVRHLWAAIRHENTRALTPVFDSE